MGLLIDGQWQDHWYDTAATGGRFEREEARFRHWISDDPASPYPAEAGRYHLYVSYACPWAHRTLIVRALKGLQDVVSVSVVGPDMLEQGWEIAPGADPIHGARFLHQVYTAAQPTMTGRVTVPLLWDKVSGTIVSNESSEIIRMFNSAFGALAQGPDFYPLALREQIDAINSRIYPDVNNGVYRAGFATTQQAYDEAYDRLFRALDWLEQHLSQHRYLVGEQITEADWRLFTTLVRFDAVYFGHFKCNAYRIADTQALAGYVRDLYQVPGVAETVRLDHIKAHYYRSQRTINPGGVVPKGGEDDFSRPHTRHELV
ncbi:glutathione S-transferase family protein [Insolitispirillum peregrinum]|uniref:glutathione S-transferase family protein n=1 Tax=Insolitispirillum peregrinum TaxID=80876 RepID=UPI00362364B8